MSATFTQNVRWISGTEQKQWVSNNPIELKNATAVTSYDAEIYPNQNNRPLMAGEDVFNELGWMPCRYLMPKIVKLY